MAADPEHLNGGVVRKSHPDPVDCKRVKTMSDATQHPSHPLRSPRPTDQRTYAAPIPTRFRTPPGRRGTPQLNLGQDCLYDEHTITPRKYWSK